MIDGYPTWSIILALLGVLGTGGVLGTIVTGFINKRKNAQDVVAAQLKNLKDGSDIDTILKEKTKAAVKEEFERNQQFVNMENQLKVTEGMMDRQGNTLTQLAKDIGAKEESERNCQAQMKEMKAEIKEIKDRAEERHEERHQETMKMFGEIKKLFANVAIVAREKEV